MDMRYGISGGGGYISRHGGGGGGGGGGGCFGRYGGGSGLYDISMVDRIMLKFRPIAPKPVASSGSGSGDCTAGNGGRNGRGKRKYVRVANNNMGSKRNKDSKKRKVAKSPGKVSGGGDTVETLSLMPETPDRKEKWSEICFPSEKLWLGFEKDCHEKSREGHVTMKQREQTVSFLVVEMVKEVKVDCGLVRWTEMEMEMERDTCPRFVTDGGDRVVWMNNACRDMINGGDEVVVMVVRNVGELPVAFTCNVRVTCQNGRRFSSLTVPCDAWRMVGGGGGGGGGYGWRLDINAALSLGR